METTDKGIVGTWQHLLDMVEANSTDLAHLEVPRVKLGSMLGRVQDLNKQQAAMTASKQEASKQIRILLTEGQRLANALRVMIKEHYGIRAEKLAEFGLQPFRGRNRKAKTPAPETPGAPVPVTHADPKI
ncbi:MAG: hypothetical protein QOF89_958 [Acidobacteriota bacterium]|jgi:hypothetical protein|nr:hypothetical protein [Acidobacteriota bacterium]